MQTQTDINSIRFFKKGVKDATGKYYPCWYSLAVLIGDTEPTITLYARSILKGLPAALSPQNDSDMMTDYFEKDRVRIRKGSAQYEEIMTKGFCAHSY